MQGMTIKTNSLIYLINSFQIWRLFLLSLIPVSRTTLPLLSHIYAMIETFLPKQFIIQWTSLPLKQNFFQSDVESTKLFKFLMLNTSLLLQTLFQLQDIFLICPFIHSNCIPLQFLKILEHSSTRTLTTLLLFGTVLAVTNGLLIQQLIKKLNNWKLTLFSCPSPHGILARKKNLTPF